MSNFIAPPSLTPATSKPDLDKFVSDSLDRRKWKKNKGATLPHSASYQHMHVIDEQQSGIVCPLYSLIIITCLRAFFKPDRF